MNSTLETTQNLVKSPSKLVYYTSNDSTFNGFVGFFCESLRCYVNATVYARGAASREIFPRAEAAHQRIFNVMVNSVKQKIITGTNERKCMNFRGMSDFRVTSFRSVECQQHKRLNDK